MKVLLIILGICVYAQSAARDGNVADILDNVIEEKWQNSIIYLHASGQESENDKLLINELEHFEKTQGRNIISDTIANLLESFRDIVINGNDDLPPLDPLQVSEAGPFEVVVTGARAVANVYDLSMEGLRWYVVDRVDFNILRLTFGLHVTIPRIELTGLYEVQARIALFITHRSGGSFRVFLNRIEFGVDLRLGTNIFGGGHLTLRELDIKINAHDVQIRIEGMVGSNILNAAINSFIQNISQNVVQNELEALSASISDALFDVINDILKDYTLSDILGN